MNGEYQQLYRELQRRMDAGGDPSPGPQDAVGHHFRNGLRTREREQPHRAVALPFGREPATSESASLTHRESACPQGRFEAWARREGYNLLCAATLKNLDKNTRLLTDLQRQGYDQRVVLSVEVPLEQCLAQNAARRQNGRIKYEQGLDAYGGRMAPEGMIRDLHAQGASGRDDFGPGAAAQSPLVPARSFQQGDSVVRISAVGRLCSGQRDATPRPTAGPGTAVTDTPRSRAGLPAPEEASDTPRKGNPCPPTP
jgi:hypothetical protein